MIMMLDGVDVELLIKVLEKAEMYAVRNVCVICIICKDNEKIEIYTYKTTILCLYGCFIF